MKAHNEFGKTTYWLWIHSQKFGISIPYKRTLIERDPSGEPVADVFTPYFHSINSVVETLALESAQGTQLVVLCD